MSIPRVNFHSAVASLSNHRDNLALMCAAILTVVTGCSSAPPLSPSYEELDQRGFYVYVLPKSEMERRGWLQTVSIWSWDRHCKGGASGGPNPIYINYDALQEQPGLTLIIGPWNTAWDHRKSTTNVTIDTPWAMNGVAVYYTAEDYTRLRFEDRFGIPVQVSSRLTITEVVQLVGQLEYMGPLPETVTNPWDCSK